MRYGVWLSRFCLALIFLLNGFGVIDQTRATQELAAHGAPARLLPMLVVGGRIVQVIAGTALLFGVKERLAALALAAFLVPASVIAHDFWAYHGAEFQGQHRQVLGEVDELRGRRRKADRPGEVPAS